MSVLRPDAVNALRGLLVALQSPDNAVRQRGEESLATEWVAQCPDELLSGLAEQIRGHEDGQVWCTLSISSSFADENRMSFVEGPCQQLQVDRTLFVYSLARAL